MIKRYSFIVVLVLAFLFFSCQVDGAKKVPLWMKAQKDLYNQPIRRCWKGCNKFFFHILFRKILDECIYGYCPRWEGFGGVPLGTNNIATFFAIKHSTYNTNWAVRFQVDFLKTGARIVLVAVPKPTSFPEEEKFTRPYIIGPLIPKYKYRTELNPFLAWYGWTCQRGQARCTPSS